MWNISKEEKDNFLTCNLLPIHESDQEWENVWLEATEEGEDLVTQLKEELAEVKEELLLVIPSRFIPFVENGTLNQPTLPKSVREEYLQWMREKDHEFEQILVAADEQTKQAVLGLPTTVQEVFEESLHDGIIKRIERDGSTLHLYVNTESGFSTKAMVHFIFENIISVQTDEPIQVGQWMIYYELQRTNDGFALRVLYDCPDAEWTIAMKALDANYYYRPKAYVRLIDDDKLQDTSLTDFIAQLDRGYRYWFITPHVTCEMKTSSETIQLEDGKFEVSHNHFVVTVGSEYFTYPLNEYHPAEFIYTNVYESPYEHFNPAAET